jgi:hypothetical protein
MGEKGLPRRGPVHLWLAFSDCPPRDAAAFYYDGVMVVRWTFAALALLGTVLVIVELAK